MAIPLLDSFTRADAADLGVNWKNGSTFYSSAPLQIVSNAAIGSSGLTNPSWNDVGWLVLPGNDQVAAVQFAAVVTAGAVFVTARCDTAAQDVNSNCYAVQVTPTQVILGKFDAFNDFTTLATYGEVVVPGEYIAIKCVGSAISALSVISGVETLLGAPVTDTDFVGGYIGLHTVAATGFQLTNFSGGGLGGPPPLPNDPKPKLIYMLPKKR